jgi:hypothetical protein
MKPRQGSSTLSGCPVRFMNSSDFNNQSTLQPMNIKTTTTIALILLVLIIVLMPSLAMAQGGPGSGLPDDPGTPIDGGASLLAGAAALYGIKKLRDKRAK